jgi:4'-phosphopantetheinyl transferase
MREAPIEGQAVHVWVLDERCVEPACSALAYTLSSDERQRARAYKRATDRDRFVARRCMLRRLIGGYLHCQPESLRFGVTEFGKPVLQWPHVARLAFNVSQTEGIALLAFASDCRIGVDVQRQINDIDLAHVGRTIFSSIEKRMIDEVRPDSVDTFFTLWTRKEALLKALGTGLSVGSGAYTTEDDHEHGDSGWRALLNDTVISGWTCVDLDLGPKVHCALAVSFENARVNLRHCPRLT